MKIRLNLLLIFSLYSQMGHTQDIDYMMKKYYQAMGGKGRIDSVQNYSVDFHVVIDGENFSGKYINVRPYLFRYEVTSDSTGVTTCVGYDGENGWMRNSRLGKDEFKPHERFPKARNRSLHSQNFINYLNDASQNGYVMQLVGLRKIDSTMCYFVKLQNYERDMEVECYINSLDFSLKREVYSDLSVSISDPQKIFEEINYLEYTSINGLKFPLRVRRITTTSRIKMLTEYRYHNYRINQKVEESELRCKL